MALPQEVIGTGITGATAATTAMPIVPAPYDSVLYHQPLTNSKAIVTFPATPGKTWIIAAISASLQCDTGGPGYSNDWVSVRIPGIVWQQALLALYTVAQGGIDHFDLSGLAISGAVGTAVTVQFNAAAGANACEIVSAGAYLV